MYIHWNPHLARPPLLLGPAIALPKEISLLASRLPPHVCPQNRWYLSATSTLTFRYCLMSIIGPVESVILAQSSLKSDRRNLILKPLWQSHLNVMLIRSVWLEIWSPGVFGKVGLNVSIDFTVGIECLFAPVKICKG